MAGNDVPSPPVATGLVPVTPSATNGPPPEEEKRDPSFEEFHAFLQEFNSESDRAAVVLGAARLDATLYDLLVAFLQPTAAAADSLFDGDAPLGAFSVKIDLAYRLGLIDADCARALHLVRKIRNGFAHDVHGCSLTSGAHGDRLRELVRPLHKWSRYESWCKTMGGKHTGPSLDFRMVVALLDTYLDHALNQVKRVAPTAPKYYPHDPAST